MRFNAAAYEKLYPRQKAAPVVETAVEGFTPSVKEVHDEKVVETTPAVEAESEGSDGGNGTVSTDD